MDPELYLWAAAYSLLPNFPIQGGQPIAAALDATERFGVFTDTPAPAPVVAPRRGKKAARAKRQKASE